MKKSAANLLKKILLFLCGLINIIPSKINLYEHIINFIEKDILSSNTFYLAIVLGIWLFRIIIVLATIYEAYDIYRYNQQYRIVGYN